MKYMLMFWMDESAEPPPDDGAALVAAIGSWVDEMTGRGIRLDGNALGSAAESRFVQVRDGEMLVSDGPYAETKEQVGGYDIIECADLGLAIEVAAAHPLARTSTVEVRPFGNFPADE
jgi:hypothetical protein